MKRLPKGHKAQIMGTRMFQTMYTADQMREFAQPSKPWVQATTWRGLTNEEVIIMSRYDLEYAALIGEVQRKLKEKNT